MRATKLLLHVVPAALVAGFALWCGVRLRSDLESMSLQLVWHSWPLVLVAGGLSLLNYLLRSLRWRGYLARLGLALPFGFASLTYGAGFAFTLSPGKLGEVVRARYYTPLGLPVRHVAAAFCLERLLDALAVVALSTSVLSLFPRYSGAIWGTASGIAGVTVLAGGLPYLLRWSESAVAARFLARLPGFVPRILRGLAGMLRASGPLLKPKALLIGLGLGLLAWGCEGVGLYVLSFMFPPAQLTLQVAIGIYSVAVLAGAVSMLPGGLGGTEAVMTALLSSQGYPVTAAVLITLACRLVTLWFAVVLGWGAILALRGRKFVLQELPWQSPSAR